MSQSPEGSADDFHNMAPSESRSSQRLSQSPEGSADDFHTTYQAPSTTPRASSLNPPEGSADDFHGLRGGIPRPGETCLNPPKGPPTISTWAKCRQHGFAPYHLVSIPRRVRRRFPHPKRMGWWKVISEDVSIPRRVRRRFPCVIAILNGVPVANCLNPPKGPPTISTPYLSHGQVSDASKVSQSPEGSADDFHSRQSAGSPYRHHQCLNPPKGPTTISTPRSPLPVLGPTINVSIPRRVRRRFPRGPKTSSPLPDDECLNPPKGPPTISTYQPYSGANL